MTKLCTKCNTNTALPRRAVCLPCYQERARELSRTDKVRQHAEKPKPMTADEFEKQFEPEIDGRHGGKR